MIDTAGPEPLETRTRVVSTIDEARNEIERLDAIERERRARELLKRNETQRELSRARAERQSHAEREALKRREEVDAELRAKCSPELFERIKPFGNYTLIRSLPGSGQPQLLAAFWDDPAAPADAEKRLFLAQSGFGQAVDWNKPPTCPGHDLPDFVSSHLAVDPSIEDLHELRAG